MKPGPLVFLLAVSALLLAGCESNPKTMYVPGEGYRERLALTAPPTAHVGEWVDLDATRETGPWVPQPWSEPKNPTCWWRRPPPAVELHVQNNVKLDVAPAGRAELSQLDPADIRTRRIRFTAPGTYTLTAESAGCPGPFRSAPITITVSP